LPEFADRCASIGRRQIGQVSRRLGLARRDEKQFSGGRHGASSLSYLKEQRLKDHRVRVDNEQERCVSAHPDLRSI
jgi:hypothetical protein